jgi:hypothetical protein
VWLKEIEMREELMMSRAIEEAIEQRRIVHWIRYASGEMAKPVRIGKYAICAGFVGLATSAGMVAA